MAAVLKRCACWTALVGVAAIAAFIVYLSVKRIAFVAERQSVNWQGGCDATPYNFVECTPSPVQFFTAWAVELIVLAIVLAVSHRLWRSVRHANPAT